MNVLAAEHIEISYPGKIEPRVLLRDFDLELQAGSTLAVTGRNGSGKSSLLRVLAGIQIPQKGRVRWNDRDLASIPRRERPRTASALFSNFARVPGLTVEELVALGRQPYAGLFGRLTAVDREAIGRAMDMVGVGALAQAQVVHLSDGEYKKTLLAKLLAQDTSLLILDEPAAHLDIPASLELMLLLKNLAADLGKTVVLTSHELSLAFQFADRVLLLDGNGGYALGTSEYVTNHEMMCAFLNTDKARFEKGNLIVDLGGAGDSK